MKKYKHKTERKSFHITYLQPKMREHVLALLNTARVPLQYLQPLGRNPFTLSDEEIYRYMPFPGTSV